MDYEKKYNEALERARKIHSEIVNNEIIGFPGQIEGIFPELRESEGEMVRKRAIAILKQQRDYWSYDGPMDKFPPAAPRKDLVDATDVALSYLEKQKDAFENGRQFGIMQEQARQELEWTDEKQKEHQNSSDAPKKALGGALISPLDKDMNLDEIAQDYVDNVKEYNPEPTWDLMQTAVCYGYHYREQQEQKPELVQHPPITFTYNSNASRDERLKAALLALLNSDLLKVKEGGYFTKQDLIEWVERIPTDKPAEWSEEDEKMIDDIIYCLPKMALGNIMMLPSVAEEYANRLKSLRPQPHWKPNQEQED